MPLSRITNPFLQVSSAGSVSSPALSTSGDTNTGIFFPAADTIAFSEGGAEVMRIDSSGNMGIGTTSPVAGSRLTVVGGGTQLSGGTSAQAGFRFQTVSGVATITGINNDNNAYNPIAFFTSGTEAARIDSAGRMTMTSQPFFFAKMTNAQTGYNATSTGDVVVIYDTATTNTGSHYNTANGKFTAPVAGNYIFYASAYSSGTTFNQSWLVVNGSRGAYGTDWINSTASNMAHGFWLIKLAASDTVGYHPYNASVTSATIATSPEHTHFRGYLLS